MTDQRPGRAVGYVLKGYPRRSELFIASEIWRLEQLGVPLRLFVLKAADESEHHDVVDRIRVEPHYLPDLTTLTGQPVRQWLRENVAAFRGPLIRTARRHPVGVVRAAAAAAAQSWRARRGWRPRTIYLKELLQATALCEATDAAGDVGSLHAHFAHGTTTVTWLAGRIAGLPFSFTGHAKDIYRESLNPAGLLARKIRAATFVATCTRANVDHLRGLGAATPVHLVYHGLNPDFAALLDGEPDPDAADEATSQVLRVVSVGRQVPKKGFDVLLRAVAELRDRGVELELVLAGEDGDATPELDRLVAELGLADVVERRGPCSQAGLLRLYREATLFTLACRVAGDGDRDGIPNVLVEAMAAGLPVVATAVSGIPELVRDGDNGLLVPPEDPTALAEAIARLGKDPALRERLAHQGPVTVARDFDALANARRMASLLGAADLTEPRAFVCVIDDLYRDLDVARDARAGYFTHAGQRLHLGRTPDWLGGGTDDEEWRIEWVKGYEGLALAHEYAETGEADALAAWEDLVGSFCEQVPVGHDTSDVSARRIQNWLYAWQRFAQAPAWRGLRPGLADQLGRRLLADGDHLRRHLTGARNHRTLELYALLVLALAFGRTSDAAEAVGALAENAADDVLPDGVHCEGSSDYHLIVLRSFVGTIENARLAGIPVPPMLETRTRSMCDVALHLQRPDGTTPSLSDGDPGDYRPLLRRAGRLLDRPDLLWAAGAGGTPPATRLASFPDGGYFVQRSDWRDADARWCVLDCGPIGAGGHGHYDQLSVELMADGRPIVVDPGRYTYAEDGWRAWFKGTAAHNTVTVDGLDQTPYRRGKPKGPTSQASLLWRRTEPGLDVLCGRVRSPRYDAVHTRTLAFVDDNCWVVHDRLGAGGVHDYTAHWHLDHDAERRVEVTSDGVRAVVVTAPRATFVVPEGYGDVGLEPGWVSPEYGVKHRAPVVQVSARGCDVDLLTVVTPGRGAPAVSARPSGDGVVVELAGTTLELSPTGVSRS